MFKWVGRYDPTMRMLRLCRWVWVRGTVGDGNGYSAKFSIALWPSAFHAARSFDGWAVTVLGVRLHLQRSYGGIYAV